MRKRDGRKMTNGIVETDDVLGGSPRIVGTRIGVSHVVEDVLYGKYTIDEAAYMLWPDVDLVEWDIHAALEYYYDNQEEIDEIRNRDPFETDEIEKEQRDFEWAEGVILVDERSLPCVVERPCEQCDALEVHATMAETESDGFGPSWVCTECGGVERI